MIYVHYNTILTHATQGDARHHPPYDDRIIARLAAWFACTIATQGLAKGHRRHDIVAATLTDSMSVNSWQAQRTGTTAAPPCASCSSWRDRLNAVGTNEPTHWQPIAASPNSSPHLCCKLAPAAQRLRNTQAVPPDHASQRLPEPPNRCALMTLFLWGTELCRRGRSAFCEDDNFSKPRTPPGWPCPCPEPAPKHRYPLLAPVPVPVPVR